MSLDLFERETSERMTRLVPAPIPEVGVWDGFVRGTGLATMRGLAKVGRSIDLLGAVGPIAQDAISGGTEAQERYFREHEEVWGSAVDYWTPKPLEVGAAAEVAGTLASILPLVLVSPGLAVGATQVSVAEELVKKGVSAAVAQAVGGAQAAGLGLGIYVPIFGRTLAQRVLAGGVGFNLLQGISMRGAGEFLLKGTPGEGEFKAFDPTGLTVDVLLGAAFGGLVHLLPTARAQGAEMWDRIEKWGRTMKPSDVDALSTLRQAQHLNVDSLPGRPAEPVDLDRHVQRMRTALEQLLRDEPVAVSDLSAPRFEPDTVKLSEMEQNARTLGELAEGVRKSENLGPVPPRFDILENPNLTPEQRVVEIKARAQVLADPEGQLAAYAKLPDSSDGKIINVDVARQLFPDFIEKPWTHSPWVHEPASALMKELYSRRLAQPDPTGLNMVTFTAGGTGAGKTSALGAVPLASHIVEASQVVYDTNMSSVRSAVQKIDLALAHGKQVNIVYVGADPVEALKRALRRAMKIGRTVPLEDHAATHRGAAEAMEALQEFYRGNDRVQFVFLDNGVGPKGEVSIVSPENSRSFLRSLNFDNLEARLKETLDAEYKSGRISEDVYRGTQGALAEGTGAAPRPRGAEEPAAGKGPGERLVAGAREEVDFKVKPEPGEKLLVYRLGAEGGLENRNAGNARALGMFLQRLDDIDAPAPAGGTGNIITLYEVSSEKGFGPYTTFDRGMAKSAAGAGLPGRRALGMDTRGVEYSFPAGTGWQARPVVNVTLAEVRAALKQISELDNFDDAGGKLSMEALQKAIESKLTESEAPAAPRGEAVSPPPRGLRRAEAAGVEGTRVDPLELEAERVVREQPNLMLRVGQDNEGKPIVRSAREFLDDAAKDAQRSADQAKLVQVAAECLLGVV